MIVKKVDQSSSPTHAAGTLFRGTVGLSYESFNVVWVVLLTHGSGVGGCGAADVGNRCCAGLSEEDGEGRTEGGEACDGIDDAVVRWRLYDSAQLPSVRSSLYEKGFLARGVGEKRFLIEGR